MDFFFCKDFKYLGHIIYFNFMTFLSDLFYILIGHCYTKLNFLREIDPVFLPFKFTTIMINGSMTCYYGDYSFSL